jgi:hypothetical protein
MLLPALSLYYLYVNHKPPPLQRRSEGDGGGHKEKIVHRSLNCELKKVTRTDYAAGLLQPGSPSLIWRNSGLIRDVLIAVILGA